MKIKFKYDLTVLTREQYLISLLAELDKLGLAYVIEKEELYFFVNISLANKPSSLVTNIPGLEFDEALQELFYSAYKTASWCSHSSHFSKLKSELPTSVTIEAEHINAHLFKYKLIWPATDITLTDEIEQLILDLLITSL